MKKFLKNKTGSTLLMTIFILTGTLGITLAVSEIIISGLKMGRERQDSTKAFFAAESGIEKMLHVMKNNPFDDADCDPSGCGVDLNTYACITDCSYQSISLNNNAAYKLRFSKSGSNTIFTSIGSFRKSSRGVAVSYNIGSALPPSPPPDSCVPEICSSLGYECGLQSDDCGGTIDCGSCPDGESCSALGVCEVSPLPPGATSPINLSLNHSTRNKTFTVSWTAGSGNGGVGGCQIEYQKADSSWAVVNSPTTVNCDESGASAGTISLPGDGWYGNNWSSVPVRLVRLSDSVIIGILGNLSCSSKSASISPTPTIDEDCDNIWDNRKTIICGSYTVYRQTYNVGSVFSVPLTKDIGGSCGVIDLIVSIFFKGVFHYSTSTNCTGNNHSTTVSVTGGRVNAPPTPQIVPSDTTFYGYPITYTGCMPMSTTSYKFNPASNSFQNVRANYKGADIVTYY